MRHYRAKHDPNSCMYCGASWSRPYQYRDHLEKYHRDVDPDLVLGKPPGSRCRRATVTDTGRGQLQNPLPRVVGHDRQSQVAIRCPPPMLPLPAVVKAPEIHPVFSSAEELVQLVDDVVDRSSRFPGALPGGITTANYSPRAVAAHIPFPCPHLGEYYSADLDPSGFFHLYH